MYALLTQSLPLTLKESGTFAIRIFLGSLLLAIAAQISIPAWPVPMTLHVSAVLFLGFASSPSVAVGSVLLYLFEGAIGLPVFAGFSSGIAKFFGTTGGYFFGFLMAAYLVSTLKSKASTFLSQYVVAVLGGASILLCGTLYLSSIVGLKTAFVTGLLPFVIKMFVEAGLTTVTARFLKKI